MLMTHMHRLAHICSTFILDRKHVYHPALTVALLCSLVQKLPWATKYHPVVLPLTALLFMNIDWNQKPSYLFHPLKIVCGHTHTHTSHKFHDIHIVWNKNPSVCLWGCQSQIHVSALPKTSHTSTFRVSCQVSQLKQGRRGRGWRGLLFWSVFSWIKYVIRHANTARQFLSFNSCEAIPITEGKCLFNR